MSQFWLLAQQYCLFVPFQFANMRLVMAMMRQCKLILPQDRQLIVRYLNTRQISPQSLEWYCTLPFLWYSSSHTIYYDSH